MWLAYYFGTVRYFDGRWVLQREQLGEWSIHQASYPFLLIVPHKKISVYTELGNFAAALRAGAYPHMTAVRLPAGILAEKHLKALGFTVHVKKPNAIVPVLVWIMRDELCARRNITGAKRIVSHTGTYGVMSRATFMATF